MPLPYFFCDDDGMAEILINYARLEDSQKDQLLVYMKELIAKG